jgi:hypothetical protein
MERIGDKESAIAERVRALLAATNSTVAAATTPGASFSAPAAPIPRDPRRLDPHSDPARVVANLTAAGIRLAVSFLFIFFILPYPFCGNFMSSFCNRLIVEDSDPVSQSRKILDPFPFKVLIRIRFMPNF